MKLNNLNFQNQSRYLDTPAQHRQQKLLIYSYS